MKNKTKQKMQEKKNSSSLCIFKSNYYKKLCNSVFFFFLQAILKELATKNGFVSHAKNKSNKINCLAMTPLSISMTSRVQISFPYCNHRIIK